MKITRIIVISLLFLVSISCTDFTNPLSSESYEAIGSGTTDGSGGNQTDSGGNQTDSGGNQTD